MCLMGYNWAKQGMTHKIKIVSLLMVSAMLFFVGCKKNNSENETNETPEETNVELIPEEILQLLDNCPTTNYQDISIFGFPNKINYPLDDLFAAMCKVAMHLTDTTEYQAGEDPEKEPRQKGLAYVYGWGYDPNDCDHYSTNKDFRIRRRGYLSKCPEYLHGIDCAGFIAHVMDMVGIHTINKKSLFEMKAYEQVDYFKNNFNNLNTNLYKGKVKVKEYENVSAKDIKNGDIIYKIKANNNDTATHIGVCYKIPSGKIIMFQSSGNPYTDDCTYNLHENDHGPIQKELDDYYLNKYFNSNSGKARLLRIIDSNWVDLGLPSGILWASRNICADYSEGFGPYFAWAETQHKSYYDWDTYKYWNNGAVTKYNTSDGYTKLQPTDDVATDYWGVYLGDTCRLPTKEDWQELLNNTTHTWTTQNGVNGELFTASNGESLFLPAAGFRHVDGVFSVGEFGIYWSSSRSENDPNNAWYIRFNSDTLASSEFLRLFGLSVRPVRSPN